MGACVLCGKSAGLLHSLHKNCYQQYQAETDKLVDVLASELSTLSSEQLTTKIHQQVEALPFVSEARARTLVRSLEKFTETHLHAKQDMQKYADAWPALLANLQPDESLFIDATFIARQQNFTAFSALARGELPTCNVGENATILRDKESLWWRFDDASIHYLSAPKEEKKWSVATQLINNMMPKKQKQVGYVSDTQWMLSVTNQRLLFMSDEEDLSISYQEVYSVTPIEGGIKLQCKQEQAMPQLIRCEDEKLLFLLIRYAQTSTL